jgi:hypothetical protein
MLFKFRPEIENDFGAEVVRVVGVTSVPGEELLEVVGVGGVVGDERPGDKLMAYRQVVPELGGTDHQAVEHYPAIGLSADLQVGRLDNILVVLHFGHLLFSSSGVAGGSHRGARH